MNILGSTTGTDTIPTPAIAAGRLIAITKIKLKNNAILIVPIRKMPGHCLAVGQEGLNSNNNKPAGSARMAPNKTGGHSGVAYLVTA